MSDSRFWVGTNGRDLLVFDKNMQVDSSPHVYLWNVTTRDMERYDPDLARPHMTSVRDRSKSDIAINLYSTWYIAKGAKWLSEEQFYILGRIELEATIKEKREFIKKEKEKSDTALIERHSQYLLSKGLANTSKTRHIHSSSSRKATCWQCKNPLDNNINIQCEYCGWIICSCGACGCGHDF